MCRPCACACIPLPLMPFCLDPRCPRLPPAGKLFPGPHLYAGALITVLWALAAALVPAMQKGNDTARSLHIGLNTINVLLFATQIPTGLEIVGKVGRRRGWAGLGRG